MLTGIIFPFPVGAIDEPELSVGVVTFPDDVEPLGVPDTLCELLLLVGFVVVAGLVTPCELFVIGFVLLLLLAAGFVGITLPVVDELSVSVVVVGSFGSLDELTAGLAAELVVVAGFVVGVFVAGLVGCPADGFAAGVAGEACELFAGFVVGLLVVPLLPASALTVGAAGLGTVLLTAAVLLSVTRLPCARVP